MTNSELYRDLADAIGAIAITALIIVLVRLYLVATPPQNSAECDRFEAELENANGGHGK